MSTQTAEQIHAQIETEAKAQAVPGVRCIDKIAIGKAVRQGDIYLHRVTATHPRGAACKSRQLAIGETRGSRHVVEATAQVFEGVAAPGWCQRRTLLGPLVVAETRFLVTHPEHAHMSLPPGTYQVTHQMDARTLQRVQD